jgi:hypothetical protein
MSSTPGIATTTTLANVTSNATTATVNTVVSVMTSAQATAT